MAKNYIKPGEHITFTAGAATASGQGVVIGALENPAVRADRAHLGRGRPTCGRPARKHPARRIRARIAPMVLQWVIDEGVTVPGFEDGYAAWKQADTTGKFLS